MLQVAKEHPLTNAAAPYLIAGQEIPFDGGDCAFLCRRFGDALMRVNLVDELSFLRALSSDERGGMCGEPGNHILLGTGIKKKSYLWDPTLLHTRPLSLSEGSWTSPSLLPQGDGSAVQVRATIAQNKLTLSTTSVARGLGTQEGHSFYLGNQCKIPPPSGLENGRKKQTTHAVRFVFEDDTIGQLIRPKRGDIFWVEGGLGKPRITLPYEALTEGGTQNRLDDLLAEFGVTLSECIEFLMEVPSPDSEKTKPRTVPNFGAWEWNGDVNPDEERQARFLEETSRIRALLKQLYAKLNTSESDQVISELSGFGVCTCTRVGENWQIALSDRREVLLEPSRLRVLNDNLHVKDWCGEQPLQVYHDAPQPTQHQAYRAIREWLDMLLIRLLN